MLYNLLTSLPMMVCAVLSVQLALELRNRRLRAIPELLVYMVVATVLYTGHYVFFNHAVQLIPFSDTLYLTANLSVYPLYLLYIIRLTRQRDARFLLLLLPAVAALVTVGTLYLLMDDEERRLFIDNYLYSARTTALHGLALAQAWVHAVCRVLFVAEVVFTVVVGLRFIRQYHRKLDQFYSDTEEKSLYRVNSILYLVVITSCLSFVAVTLDRHFFYGSMWLLAVPALLFSLLLFCIGFVGLHQHFSVEDVVREMTTENTSPMKSSVQKALAVRIRQIIDEQQLFLQPNLKITDLAMLLNTNRTYVHQAISQHLGTNFNELINTRRIQYAQQLKAKEPELPVSEIAWRAGFSSVSAYYRNLKAYSETK